MTHTATMQADSDEHVSLIMLNSQHCFSTDYDPVTVETSPTRRRLMLNTLSLYKTPDNTLAARAGSDCLPLVNMS